MMARVLVGKYETKNIALDKPSYKHLQPFYDPEHPHGIKKEGKEMMFDTVTDTMDKENREMFVVFKNNRCYGEYIIEFERVL